MRVGTVGMIILGVLAGCSGPSQPPIASRGNDWASHGQDASEQRFSTLDQIDTSTIDKLGLAWSLDLPDESILQATPIAVDGSIYFPGGNGKVYAVDAESGALRWTHDAQPMMVNGKVSSRIYGANRGVAYWEGKVYTATRSGHLIALDARTGEVVWDTDFIAPGTRTTSSGAPRVLGDKIIIGTSGADIGGRGYVTTMDARTGKILWRFFTVPGDPKQGFEDAAMEMAAKTWSGEWWKYGGGGTVWNGITYDPEYRQVLIGVGNGGPWNCHYRGKAGDDNLFLASVVALDADTGKYKWHYQYNPHECWDWKATSDIVLADVRIGDTPRKVMMQAPSNGFFYVIDRANGKLISAEAYAKQNWAERIDLKTGRPVEKPGIRYENGPVVIYPSYNGAHSWQASSYSPKTGLVYIPYWQLGMRFSVSPLSDELLHHEPGKDRGRVGVDTAYYVDPKDPMDGRGSLIAWDPVAQKIKWRFDRPVGIMGGAMSTSGDLVFQGDLTGRFSAFNAGTGKELWHFDAKLGIIAPPITYSVKGKQYVSVLSGPGGGTAEGGTPGMYQGWKYGLQTRRLLTFAIGGKAALPPTPPPDFTVNAIDVPGVVIDPAKVEKGAIYYAFACGACHGAELHSAGTAPDLRESGMAADYASFAQVVQGGALQARGMPKVDIGDEDLRNIYQYIRWSAREAKAGRGPGVAK
ncbi:MAG: PQQ-dependent dehydrogenase, methanol/ethanol family [Sphingopyxis macrogoltabida]|uniref:PQQ-dependent dehydrogenase, methanol/ethanol family n=1 Tax=Sphingopyxis macrogoltabida TaxID=33050 RepID=A0A2W5L1X0_SPHMC|nr:MAG: PQQ-dependent dehydrogenase, methanol/ethanol family [Sphingopyxis macrogoltabida]